LKSEFEYYGSGNDYVMDLLLKIDLLIHIEVIKFRNRSGAPELNEFSGMYISDEEIDSSLDAGEYPDISPEIENLRNKVMELDSEIEQKIESSEENGKSIPFFTIAREFDLTEFERNVLLLALAPELDLKYEKFYAYLQDNVTKKMPTVDLALNIFCSSMEEKIMKRTLFYPGATLLKNSLIRVVKGDGGDEKSFLSSSLKLEPNIVNYLLGRDEIETKIESSSKIITPKKSWQDMIVTERFKEELSRLSAHISNEEDNFSFYFCGPEGSGRKLAAEIMTRNSGKKVIFVDLKELLSSSTPFDESLNLVAREAKLNRSAIYFDNFDLLVREDESFPHYRNSLLRKAKDFNVFLAGEKEWNPLSEKMVRHVIKLYFDVPSFHKREELWKKMAGDEFDISGSEVTTLSNKFLFTGGQIRNALEEAKNSFRATGNNGEKIGIDDLYVSCHNQSNRKLSEMARKVTPRYRLEDIVLPADKFEQLREVISYVKHRQTVYLDWAFGDKLSLGKGLNALFSGSSGTGKTMAAEIIASELKLDLYKIDLSNVVSKYIGETEKNLSKIFKEAETSNAILLFDEADSIFGKRSEVKDAHDRYANIETNYLLQKMEEHEGIVLLTTNFRKNIDDAFTRRMHFVVDFPFPDEKYRLKIWEKIFPGKAPVSSEIDYSFLSRSFKITGGNIKNIALNAAFFAAEESGNIDMVHVVKGVKREYQKMGKVLGRAEFGNYYQLIMPKEEN